jgi:hypothetical protein
MAMKYAIDTCKIGAIERRYALHPIALKSTCGQETSLDDVTPANAKPCFGNLLTLDVKAWFRIPSDKNRNVHPSNSLVSDQLRSQDDLSVRF